MVRGWWVEGGASIWSPTEGAAAFRLRDAYGIEATCGLKRVAGLGEARFCSLPRTASESSPICVYSIEAPRPIERHPAIPSNRQRHQAPLSIPKPIKHHAPLSAARQHQATPCTARHHHAPIGIPQAPKAPNRHPQEPESVTQHHLQSPPSAASCHQAQAAPGSAEHRRALGDIRKHHNAPQAPPATTMLPTR